MHGFFSNENFFLEKLCVNYETPCRVSDDLVFQSYPYYLYGTIPHNGHRAQHQCYLQDAMPRQWSPGNLTRVL